jgi:hypothetical protein
MQRARLHMPLVVVAYLSRRYRRIVNLPGLPLEISV